MLTGSSWSMHLSTSQEWEEYRFATDFFFKLSWLIFNQVSSSIITANRQKLHWTSKITSDWGQILIWRPFYVFWWDLGDHIRACTCHLPVVRRKMSTNIAIIVSAYDSLQYQLRSLNIVNIFTLSQQGLRITDSIYIWQKIILFCLINILHFQQKKYEYWSHFCNKKCVHRLR